MTSNRYAGPVRVSDDELFGRDDAHARLSARMDGARWITLLGPAGVGKSALAASVARARARKARAEGAPVALIVDASGALDAREFLRRIAQMLGISGRPARGADPLARIATALDERVATLIVDDVEHSEPVSEVMSSLLERTNRVAFLITSRVAIGVPDEVPFEVAPLDVDAGVALFLARAPAEQQRDPAVVRAVVERLDGLPLAIVLAAGRSALLSVDALLSRLEEPLAVLRGGAKDVSSRHATLERALETSFASLTEDERVALACASIFERTFSADAFEAVCALALDGDPFDALESLLRKSLVERSQAPGAVRFRLLHVVRAFARKHLPPVDDAARARYETYFEEASARLARETYGARAPRAMGELEQMLPDVLAAFGSAVAGDARRAASLWVALFDVILFRDVVALDDPRFEAAIDAADRAGAVHCGLRVRARILRARALLELGPPESAATDLRNALALAIESDDARLIAEARRSLGWMELASGRPAEAVRELEGALASSVALRDTRGHADALAAMGLAESLLGDPQRGRESLELARALHGQQKDDMRRGRVDDMLRLVTPLASVDQSARGEDAEAALLAAANRHEARGQNFRLAFDLALLADLQDARGDVTTAAAHRLRARAAARAAGLGALEEIMGRRPSDAAPAAPAPGWLLGEDGRTLQTPEGTTLDLVRHGSLRRVLDALVVARTTSPGSALSASDILAAGWPGERVLHDAGLLRVYSAIRRLRRMGLEAVLVTRDDGYLLDPTVPFARAN